MIYQQMNSVGSNRFEMIIYDPLAFPPHMHRYIEFSYVLRGEVRAVIHGKEETAQEGEGFFVFSNHVHSYQTPSAAQVAVFIVSNDYIPLIAATTNAMAADHYVFRPDPAVQDFFVCSMIRRSVPSHFLITASFYALFDCFLAQSALYPQKKTDQAFLQRALLYIQQHFHENISLHSLAHELGYSYHYASRAFSSITHMNFRQYLNLYRIDYARSVLSQTDLPITTIALDCGFQNIRSFNRAFAAITQQQPTQYRQSVKRQTPDTPERQAE